MVEVIRKLQEQLNRLDGRLAQVKTVQVGVDSIRNSARELVDSYFRDLRQSTQPNGSQSDLLSQCDSDMQNLLEATHHRTTVKVYRQLLRSLRRGLQDLEKGALIEKYQPQIQGSIDGTDRKIVETLKRLVPSAALSYEQAIVDIHACERLSWRGPATDLREALRECLDHLAPDDFVIAQPGFKPEPQTNGPTMRQKVRFILKTRGMSKAGMQSPESATEAVEEAVGSFVRSVYTRSNVSTHTPTDKREVLRVRDWVRVALCELLEIQ